MNCDVTSEDDGGVPAALANVPLRAVSVGLQYGLGNQLFMMAAAFGYGAATGRVPVIDMDATMRTKPGAHTRECYANTIFKRFARVTEPLQGAVAYQEPLHDAFRGGSKIPAFPAAARVKIRGFFIGEHLVRPVAAAFRRALCLPRVPRAPNTVFMHMRRGDTISVLMNRILYVYDLKEYCARAMALVRARLPGVRIRVFSDDLDWCKAQALFAAPDVEFEDERHSVTALAKMAACGAGGICWNSTFSWWAAYLNPNPAKLVTLPLQYNKIVPVDVWPAGAHIISSGPALLADGTLALTCIIGGAIILALMGVCIYLGVRHSQLVKKTKYSDNVYFNEGIKIIGASYNKFPLQYSKLRAFVFSHTHFVFGMATAQPACRVQDCDCHIALSDEEQARVRADARRIFEDAYLCAQASGRHIVSKRDIQIACRVLGAPGPVHLPAVPTSPSAAPR
jgi:hypothetical protein